MGGSLIGLIVPTPTTPTCTTSPTLLVFTLATWYRLIEPTNTLATRS